jgi:Tfp pilus assembly protein PilO
VAFGWYFLLWSPQQSKISSLNSQVSTLESQQSALQVQISQLESAKQHLPQLIAEAKTITGAIPSNPDLSGFLSVLQSAASSAGVAELSVSPTAPAATPGASTSSGTSGVTPLGVTISANGGYLEVLKFLSSIQSLPRLLVVSNVSIAKGGSASSSLSSSGPVLSLQLTGSIYELS